MARSYVCPPRGALDRLADAHIGAASADISSHRGVDVGIVGMRRLGQQRGCRHDLAGLAITALDHFKVEPRLLHFGAGLGRTDAFDRGDGAAANCADREQTRAHRITVDVHGAGAALRDAAAEFRARHSENVAQDPQQRHVGFNVSGQFRAIDIDLNGHGDLHALLQYWSPDVPGRQVILPGLAGLSGLRKCGNRQKQKAGREARLSR